MAGILLALGVYLLLRFSRPLRERRLGAAPLRSRFLAPLGLVAGFIDSTGGGGWGPVATPALLVSGRMEPRKVIGSVDTSEFVVAAAASIGFLIGLGSEGFVLPTVAALLVGGIIAAPLAAWLVRIVPAQVLGAAVGGIIVLTNGRTLMRAYDVPGGWRIAVYSVIVAGWIVAGFFAVRAPAPHPGAGRGATGVAGGRLRAVQRLTFEPRRKAGAVRSSHRGPPRRRGAHGPAGGHRRDGTIETCRRVTASAFGHLRGRRAHWQESMQPPRRPVARPRRRAPARCGERRPRAGACSRRGPGCGSGRPGRSR